MGASALGEVRRGRNIRHHLPGLLREAVYGRLAGYEDVNDAERLARDSVMRAIVGREGIDRPAASTSQMGRFETEWLASEANLAVLTDLSGAWIDRVHVRRPPDGIILDMDSSESPTHRQQEGSGAATSPAPEGPARSCRAACRCDRSPARSGSPTGGRSPSPSRLHHRPDRGRDGDRVHRARDLDPNAARQRDLDRAWLGRSCGRCSASGSGGKVGPIWTGSSFTAGGLAGSANRRRHLNSWLAFRSCRRARSTPTRLARASPRQAHASKHPASADAWHPLRWCPLRGRRTPIALRLPSRECRARHRTATDGARRMDTAHVASDTLSAGIGSPTRHWSGRPPYQPPKRGHTTSAAAPSAGRT